MSKRSIERTLALAQVALDNALADADLAAALLTFGYDTSRLNQGIALRDAAQTLVQQQRAAYGDLFAAQDVYKTAWQQARAPYIDLIKIARVAFEHDRGARQTLGLATRRRADLAGWHVQAQQFYDGALARADILHQLAIYGITPAMLEAGRQRVATVLACDAARRQRRGGALDATRRRDTALAALESWMRDFLKVAHIALKDRPQLLARLGVAAPAPRRGRAAEPATLTAATSPAAGDRGLASSDTPDGVQPAARRRNGRAALSEHPI